MSDVIKLLPDSVANQIAAGEVIQRPASVIKELVENAIDAGATLIQIILKEAGRTLIQVIDNGKGMSPTDARLAFERHSTSKIRSAEDLFTLQTMGFRGEALASIAAIAQVELKSRRPDDEIGTCVCISASQCESQEPVSCPSGSNFSVKNIFFNVPARRKFLKSNQIELSNILTEFERIALINTGVEFSLSHNGNELFNLPASNFRQRIISIFGKSLNQQLLTVEVKTSLVEMEGYIGKPEAARKRNALQYFFVNGRYMRHPYFHKAVMTCYENLVPVGEMPNYFLNLKVDPASIDVNIHPTKTEIKFENEQPIWQIISASIKETLGKFGVVPSIDFDMADAPEIPVFHNNPSVKPPRVDFDPAYNPFKSSPGVTGKRPEYDWKQLYDGFRSGDRQQETGKPSDNEVIFESRLNKDEIVDGITGMIDIPENGEEQILIDGMDNVSGNGSDYLQLKGRYILAPVKSGLAMIDQHRAHVRILFDEYIRHISLHKGISQRILFPEIIKLTSVQAAVLQEISEDLLALGFELSDMGHFSYAVNGVPSGIEGVDVKNLISSMIDSVTEKGNDIKNDVHQRIALSLARAAAIPVGQVLSVMEMDRLVGDLFVSAMPNYTPDGQVIIHILTDEDIKRFFS